MKAEMISRYGKDFWAGLAAMLVALPSAIAFGVAIYSPLGGFYAAQGALAGILGATALGLIAPAIGGANRLISAPCAPAAAVLSAFAIEMVQGGVPLGTLLLQLTVLGLTAGLLQVLFGLVGLGRLIKYMPYPVVSGYLSGVGLIIIASQVPKFLGVHAGLENWRVLLEISGWRWHGILVGVVTIGVMLGAGRFTRAVPSAILGLLAGVCTYFGLGLVDASLLVLDNNPLVIGPLGNRGGSFTAALTGRWHAIGALGIADLQLLLMPALTLAVLLSIDTLKTCIVLDALTRSRHNSNRVLIGQGLGNIGSAMIGGVPGAGTMGATLVNLSSGAQTRLSGLLEGGLALGAFLLFGSMIAWVPVASLSGILIVVGCRMIDRHSLRLLKSRSTVLDFVVIVSVIAVALTSSLIAASAVGIVLAILLFVREQMGGQVVHRKVYGNQHFSKRVRLREEMDILVKQGDQAVIFSLQGSLFFGTADQLYNKIEPELKSRKYVILDMRRVQSVDMTAAHLLEQLIDILSENGGFLLFSHIPHALPSGQDMQLYFDRVGLVRSERPVRIFDELDEALEWVEDRIISEAAFQRSEEHPLALEEFEMFKGRKEKTLAELEAHMEIRRFRAGDHIFRRGDSGDELFLIRSGEVRLVLPLEGGKGHHLGTLARGGFFGEVAFLDSGVRSADAIAFTNTEMFVLTRRTFEVFAHSHKKASVKFLEGLASVLARRLRVANTELRVLES